MTSRPGGFSLAVTARVAPALWRPGTPSEVSVDEAGLWHFRTAAGVCSILPDQIDMGPCGLWMTLAGPTAPAVPGVLRRRRVRATVWAASVSRHEWRRLRIAAHWHMQRAAVPSQGIA